MTMYLGVGDKVRSRSVPDYVPLPHIIGRITENDAGRDGSFRRPELYYDEEGTRTGGRLSIPIEPGRGITTVDLTVTFSTTCDGIEAALSDGVTTSG